MPSNAIDEGSGITPMVKLAIPIPLPPPEFLLMIIAVSASTDEKVPVEKS